MTDQRALACPHCGSSLHINTEAVGPAYLTYERPESIECETVSCAATWEPDGTPRDVPAWVRYPEVYDRPALDPERARRELKRTLRVSDEQALCVTAEQGATCLDHGVGRDRACDVCQRSYPSVGACESREEANWAAQPIALAPDREALTDALTDALTQVIADHPMWIGDDGRPLDYLPEREARIADAVSQQADAVLAVLVGLAARQAPPAATPEAGGSQ